MPKVGKGSEPMMVQELREAIGGDGRSQNQLAKAAGLDNSRLSRFVRGERDLTFEAACRLCDVLGITFKLPRPSKGPKGNGRRREK